MEFSMSKPAFSSVLITSIILLFITLVIICLAIIFISADNYTMTINNETIQIKSVIYNTKIDISEIDHANIKVRNLDDDNFKLTMRTNGIGLPGLKIGWFTSNGGKYKLYVTDRKQVIQIPILGKYTILFSSNKANEIVEVIKSKIK